MGISKQRLYYWEICSYATLPRKTVCSVVGKAKTLFNLNEKECNALAASAGISLTEENKSLYQAIRNVYSGTIRKLCAEAAIDERAFRNYKYKSPPKHALLAICTVLGFNGIQTDKFLHKFGYCLSESVFTDRVVAFYLRKNSAINGTMNLNAINQTLFQMGISPLITKA